MKKSPLLIILLSILSSTWAIHYAALHMQNGPKSFRPARKDEPSAFIRSIRPHYPYSIIPGGAYSPVEFREAIKDPVVRAHYTDFDITHARMVVLTDDSFQYVSYRLKNQVYWTKRKLRIPKGELLATDGTNWARARCGNRLSDKPHLGYATAEEPESALLNLPPVMPLSNSPLNLPTSLLGGIPGTETPTPIASTAAPPGTPAPVTGEEPILTAGPVVGPIVPGSPLVPGTPLSPGSPSNPGNPAAPPPPVTPPTSPVPVPEPATVVLFLISFGLMIGLTQRLMTLSEKK